MRSLGLAAVIIGATISVSAFLFVDVAVGDVVNFVRLQTQTLLFQGGCAIFIAGAVVTAIGTRPSIDAELPAATDAKATLGAAIAAAFVIAALTYTFGSTRSLPPPAVTALPTNRSASGETAEEMATRMEHEADAAEANEMR